MGLHNNGQPHLWPYRRSRTWCDYTNHKGKQMKLDLKNAWIQALKSGKYKQGNGKFGKVITKEPEIKTITTNGVETTMVTTVVEREHCCLGVLWEILPNFTHQYPELQRVFEAHSLQTGTFGFSECEILGIPPAVQEALVTINDRKHEGSFELVADVIAHLVPHS